MSGSGEQEGLKPHPNILNKDFLVPLSLVAGIVVFVLGGWRYFDDRFSSLQSSFDSQFKPIQTSLDTLDRRMERLENDEKRLQGDRWTYTDQRLWVSELRRLNPTCTIPEAKK